MCRCRGSQTHGIMADCWHCERSVLCKCQKPNSSKDQLKYIKLVIVWMCERNLLAAQVWKLTSISMIKLLQATEGTERDVFSVNVKFQMVPRRIEDCLYSRRPDVHEVNLPGSSRHAGGGMPHLERQILGLPSSITNTANITQAPKMGGPYESHNATGSGHFEATTETYKSSKHNNNKMPKAITKCLKESTNTLEQGTS